MLFVFGVLAAPVLCRLLVEAWGHIEERPERPIVNAGLILAGIAIAAAAFPGRAVLEEQVRAANPAGAVNYIRHAGLTGRILNDYTWGGYRIWALLEQKVFIDGRADNLAVVFVRQSTNVETGSLLYRMQNSVF